MKKLLSTLTLCAIILFGITSCGDDTGPQFGPEQNPTKRFVDRLTLLGVPNDINSYTSGGIYEFQKDGRITKLCVMAPNDRTYQLTIWEPPSTVITTISVTADSGQVVCGEIPEVLVTAGGSIAVTMTGAQYYIWDNGGATIIPTTSGDVEILGFGFKENPIGIQFPDEFKDDFYFGLSDFVFEPLLD